VFINDLVAECSVRQNMPLVVVINSWDNPSTKRAVVGQPNHLLVWGAQTVEHAQRFMGMPPEKVTAFGAAQFDVFSDPPRQTRAEFCLAHGIDPGRRVVLFAGSNARTDEVAALDALDDAIETGRAGPLTIIYRPHPWGGGGKGGARLSGRRWRHVVVDRHMRDYLAGLSAGGKTMTLPDYRDTHEMLCHVDAVVSPMSTILLEAALHGKPVAAYLPESGNETLRAMIPLLHLEQLLAIDDVILARGFDELVRALLTLASDEGLARGARLRSAARHFVAPFSRPWRERIVDLLRQTVQEKVAVDHLAAE
jgi:glycosyltransferase involved in cell wall biosynthesis